MGGFFQVTPSNFPLFVSFKGILSKFSYVEPNPYYRLFVNLGSDVTSHTEIRGGVKNHLFSNIEDILDVA